METAVFSQHLSHAAHTLPQALSTPCPLPRHATRSAIAARHNVAHHLLTHMDDRCARGEMGIFVGLIFKYLILLGCRVAISNVFSHIS